jgi:hypothetical protein
LLYNQKIEKLDGFSFAMKESISSILVNCLRHREERELI